VERTYLLVPPEEKAEVQALGARWDAHSKCWYIGSDAVPAAFSKWLPPEQGDEGFTITSDQAHVAAAKIACQQCHSLIEVICIHCETGTVSGEQLSRFTVSHVWAIDENLARQLRPWPTFREVRDPDEEGSYFANHCPRCGSLQDDMYLHSEPDQPFFDIPCAAPGSITLTPLAGPVQLSGDEHFAVD